MIRHGGQLRFRLPSLVVSRRRSVAGYLVRRVSDGAIRAQAPLEHLRQYRHRMIDIVEDQDIPLRGMRPMQAAGVLDQCPPPGDGQRQEEGIKTCVIEALGPRR